MSAQVIERDQALERVRMALLDVGVDPDSAVYIGGTGEVFYLPEQATWTWRAVVLASGVRLCFKCFTEVTYSDDPDLAIPDQPCPGMHIGFTEDCGASR